MEVSPEDEAPRPGSFGYPLHRSRITRRTVSRRNTWEGPVSKFLSTFRRSHLRLALADIPKPRTYNKPFSSLALPGETPTPNLAGAARSQRKCFCFGAQPRNREPRLACVCPADECRAES